jgi:hypothetical protein
MAEVAQYSFDLTEVGEHLIKAQGLHQGLWTVGFEMMVNVGAFGATPAEAKPGAALLINKVTLQRHTDGPKTPLTLDAAAINPPPST